MPEQMYPESPITVCETCPHPPFSTDPVSLPHVCTDGIGAGFTLAYRRAELSHDFCSFPVGQEDRL